MTLIELFANVHEVISRPILLAALGVLCIVFGVSSWVLMFHWDKYAIDKSSIKSAQLIYFSGGFLILLVAILSVTLY